MNPKQFETRLSALQVQIAAKRDKLDELISDGTAILESCERAEQALQEARDALSELL